MTESYATRGICVTVVDGRQCGRGIIRKEGVGWEHWAAPHTYAPHEITPVVSSNSIREELGLPPYSPDASQLQKEFRQKVTEGEVRITNEKTGGQKGSKDAKYHLIPAGPLKELAELYGFGAKKYAPRNWELGYDWSLSYDALQRHANQFWAGEDKDEETGKSHLASVIFHAMALMQFAEEHPELDDRPHILKEKKNAEEA